MDICTLSRTRWLSKLLWAAFTLAALCTPAAAEDGRRAGKTAQAELHIQVIVAPVVFPPRKDHDRGHDADDAAVIYNLSSSITEKLSISHELRTMLMDSGRQEQVQVTTVVMK